MASIATVSWDSSSRESVKEAKRNAGILREARVESQSKRMTVLKKTFVKLTHYQQREPAPLATGAPSGVSLLIRKERPWT